MSKIEGLPRTSDGMGQDGPKGKPDAAALAAVRAAQEVPADAPVVGEEAAAAPDGPRAGLRAELLGILRQDPGLIDELREVLGVPAGTAAAPSRVQGWRDFSAPELRVFGGTEVRHPEWEGPNAGSPPPPSGIKAYLLSDGKGGIEMDRAGRAVRTVYEHPHVERRKRSVPVVDPSTGKNAVNGDGSPVYQDEFVDVVINRGAARDAMGRPIRSPEYERWLQVRVTGARLDGEVMSQIRVGMFGHEDQPAVVVRGDEPVVAGVDVSLEAVR